MEQITKEWTFAEAMEKYPETMEIFLQFGMHCVGCPIATQETIGQGAEAHSIDVAALLKKLNEVVKKGGKE